MDEELDKSEIFDKYLDEENLRCFEGDPGVERLNKICKQLGYSEDGFKYGSSLENFLKDNSGASEAIVDWIRDHLTDEQIEGFKYDECKEEEENVAP